MAQKMVSKETAKQTKIEEIKRAILGDNKRRGSVIDVQLPDLFKAVSSETKKENKIELIRKYYFRSAQCKKRLQHLIELLYHPKVQIDLPAEIPVYDVSMYQDYNYAPMNLTRAFAKIGYFVPSQPQFIQKTLQRESVFMRIVESLYKDDAELFVNVLLLRKLPKTDVYKGMTRKFLEDAVPEIFESILNAEANEAKKQQKNSTSQQ